MSALGSMVDSFLDNVATIAQVSIEKLGGKIEELGSTMSKFIVDEEPAVVVDQPLPAKPETVAALPETENQPENTDAKPKKATKEAKPKKAASKPKNRRSYPSYEEMIKDAIVTLKEKNGSSHNAIAKFLEEKYEELPSNFRKLLSIQSKKLVASGKLVKEKRSFKVPSAKSSAAPKPAAKKPAAAKPN